MIMVIMSSYHENFNIKLDFITLLIISYYPSRIYKSLSQNLKILIESSHYDPIFNNLFI